MRRLTEEEVRAFANAKHLCCRISRTGVAARLWTVRDHPTFATLYWSGKWRDGAKRGVGLASLAEHFGTHYEEVGDG